MTPLDSFKKWLGAPFAEPQDTVSWICAIVGTATIAYLWTRVLAHVMEDAGK